MEKVLQEIIDHYREFFSLEAFEQIFLDPYSWGVIGSLVLLEGLLSSDNALVLAVMVKHLPKEQRRKALFYGIFGAYLFRFLIIGIGISFIQKGWIMIVAGHYLLYIALKTLLQEKAEEEEVDRHKWGFWGTILTVEMMDIAFSIDSIVAALGVSNQEWVLFFGGIIGILMMRGAAQLFLGLIKRVPEFEATSFVLIAIIGVKMIVSPFGYHMNEIVFFGLLICVFLGTFIVHWMRKDSGNEPTV
jgi:YkoY family integral membrane protein